MVMDMESSYKSVEPTILLGRLFMATSKTIIDVHDGKLSMTVLGETVRFEVSNSLLLPVKTYMNECTHVDEIDAIVDEFSVKQFSNRIEAFSNFHEGDDCISNEE